MKFLIKAILFSGALLTASALFIQDANAARSSSGGTGFFGGDNSIGFGGSTVSAGQNDLNSIIDSAHASANANTKNLGAAYEFYVNWIHKIAMTSYAVVLRPSYFMQSEKGTGTGGSFDYSLSGFAVFPIFRIYPLENDFIHFFMQAGVGYGSLSGDITAASSTLTFQGNSFGAMGGIGVDFCFTPSHCITIEGNLRYLPIERNISTGGTCSNGSIPGVSQCGGTTEVETSSTDLRTTMSGVQGLLGYTFNF